jgi:Tol biopolymer transport system component
MQSTTRRPLRAVVVLAVLPFSLDAYAQADGNVLYLSEYLYGDFYYAPLGDVDTANPRSIRPRRLRLPGNFRSGIELGNADVSFDGRRIVFAARRTTDYDWDIYEAEINLGRRRIDNVARIIHDADGGRDEDPRYSWDGSRIVYKCSNDICVYPENGYTNPVVSSPCELWVPSFDLSGTNVSYVKRCDDDPSSDRIFRSNLQGGAPIEIENFGGGPDRFAHFLADGGIVYSHDDGGSATASLWVSYPGATPLLLHSQTESDDDPYPDKHDANHIAFIGWENGGYNLFIFRYARGDAVRILSNRPVLAPVLFR